jgi:hypothetical protein
MADDTGAVSSGEMRGDLKENPAHAQSANRGDGHYALKIATVLRIDYKKMEIALLMQQGESVAREAVPLTLPGAGNRHFFGAMPEPGDLCVVGFGIKTEGNSRPFIVSWLVPGALAGYDWLPTQPYGPEEFGLSPKLRSQLEGVADRVRHKLQALDPGNIIASSAQGSDVVLDESVTIANRRGNELILRDQDQAIIFRSLQQFHAGAGFRQYSGMVQRDANLLPTQMFSSDKFWAAPRQTDTSGDTALTENELGPSPYSEGFLTPDAVFQRNEDGTLQSGMVFSSDIDPYDFLQRGLFITAQGYIRTNGTTNAIYGGKPMYRVSTGGTNSTADTSQGTFTEHRIELAHTADGTLPVTEQTDGFDADRLPSGSPQDVDPLGASSNTPFIQQVLGTVVGNDPYTEKGQELYGVPLRPVIFDGDIPSPGMVSGMGSPIESHAASLFSVRPPLTANAQPTFWSVAKTGTLMASLSGPGDTWSAEIAALAGIKIGVGAVPDGRAVLLNADGAIVLHSTAGDNAANLGVDISSDKGAVRIFAGGSTAVGGIAARQAPSGEGEGGLPGLILESATNVLVKASKTLTLSATRLDLSNIQELNVNANTALNFQSGDGISHSSASYQQAVMGKAEWTFSGPKNGLPTNGALREVGFTGNPATGFVGGTADKYRLLYGDRHERLTAGNHTTQVLVGTQTYSVGAGIFKVDAAGSIMTLGADGFSVVSPLTAKINAAAAITITAGAAVGITASAFNVTAPAVAFIGPHAPPGGVLTDGCINPLTGTPFVGSGTLGALSFRIN